MGRGVIDREELSDCVRSYVVIPLNAEWAQLVRWPLLLLFRLFRVFRAFRGCIRGGTTKDTKDTKDTKRVKGCERMGRGVIDREKLLDCVRSSRRDFLFFSTPFVYIVLFVVVFRGGTTKDTKDAKDAKDPSGRRLDGRSGAAWMIGGESL